MKKIIIVISIFIQTIFLFGEVDREGIVYLGKEAVREKGINLEKGKLVIGENALEFKEDKVIISGYPIEFPKAIITENGKVYYNSYLIEELAYSYNGAEPREDIVSLSPGITEKIYALGLGDNLVGRTIYCKYPEETKNIASIGTMLEPSFEKVIVKNPNIILMEAHYNAGFVSQLKRVGVDYRVYETPKSLDEMYEHLIDLGVELGVEARARILVASIKSKSMEYLKKSDGSGVKPTVYYALGTGRAEYTAGGDTFIGDIITHSGGINVAGNKKGWNFSLEELIAKNPEYIIGDSNSIKTLRSEKKYSLLRAVREDKLIEVDTDVYNLPGVRAVNIGIPIIYRAIH